MDSAQLAAERPAGLRRRHDAPWRPEAPFAPAVQDAQNHAARLA